MLWEPQTVAFKQQTTNVIPYEICPFHPKTRRPVKLFFMKLFLLRCTVQSRFSESRLFDVQFRHCRCSVVSVLGRNQLTYVSLSARVSFKHHRPSFSCFPCVFLSSDGILTLKPFFHVKWEARFQFLISNFRRVLYVVCFLLGNFLASEFYMPTLWNNLSVPTS
jgi:hypothetical protein